MASSRIIDISGDAQPGIMNFVDTTNGPITMTLPPNAAIGTTVSFSDFASNFNVNNMTVEATTEKIMGTTESMIVDTQHITFHLTYSGQVYGWRLM